MKHTVVLMNRSLFAGVSVWLFAAVLQGAALTREPNTTLKFPQKPGSFGYRLIDAAGFQFDNPGRVAFAPGDTNRAFIAELRGRIIVLTNLATPTRTVFLDVTDTTAYVQEAALVSFVFHPDYARNGRFFVHRVVISGPGEGGGWFNQVSEFRVSPGNSNAAAPEERVLIRQRHRFPNHFGGDLHFGPNGYLYGSFGDGLDPAANSQQIDRDFFSAIWRIDVDDRPGSLPPNPHPSSVGHYRIPADNPFIGATRFLGREVDPSKVRTEFWSVGLRNPFRFSVDQATGDVWIGDVGFESYESVYLSPKASNHGWPAREGNLVGILPGTAPTDFLSNPEYRYVPPIYGYLHRDGHSVMAGPVYRGSRWTELFGSFVFADHSFGWIAAMKLNPDGSQEIRGLGYLPNITSIAVNPADGGIWFSEMAGQRIWKLDHTPVFTGDPLPATLADTGAFTDLATLTPAAGLVPYEVNQSFWSDNALKKRWFCVPKLADHLGYQREDAWESPAGTVWVKHFDLELTQGVPASARRIETRFLVRNPGGVYGVTYRWDSSNNAKLVPEQGMDESIERTVNGVKVVQQWRYPSRGECLTCHTHPGGLSLSFNTAQLNRDADFGGLRTNQIAALIEAGYMADPPAHRTSLPALSSVDRTEASLEWRARSYLAANCSPCHVPGGTGLGLFDARLTTPTAEAGLINGPLRNALGDPANRVIAPGDLDHSILLQRLSTRAAGQMPPLASTVVDPAGVQILRDWILSLATPPAEVPASLTPERNAGVLSLKVSQPANRRLRLEQSTDLSQPVWTDVILPGTEWYFPAQAHEVHLHPEPGPQSVYFRVLTEQP